MSRKRYDHIHQYHTLSPESSIFRCTVLHCTHSINRAMLVGRQASCPDCSQVFTTTYELLSRARVVCGCKLREKRAIEAKPILGNIDDLLAQAVELKTEPKRKENDDI